MNLWRILADTVLLLHLAFILFVFAGGLLVVRRLRWAWIHLPAALWGVAIEITGGICPLTPLEVLLRRRGGGAGFSGTFVEHYIEPVVYPSGLTREMQVVLAIAIVTINLAFYGVALRRHRNRRGAGEVPTPRF